MKKSDQQKIEVFASKESFRLVYTLYDSIIKISLLLEKSDICCFYPNYSDSPDQRSVYLI